MNSNWYQNKVAPVRVGEELDGKIEAVGEKGDGVAKKDGFVLFVPNTNEGDEVRVRVTKVLPKVGFAEVISSSGTSDAPAKEKKAGEDGEESEEGSDSDSDEAAEELPEEETEETQEDSEDFGEDLEDKDK